MSKEYIENKTFDEIEVGDSANLVRTLTKKDILLFAYLSGDINPLHLNEEFAEESIFHQIIGPGMWEGALISAVLGSQLPGPGTIYLSQNLKFYRPVAIGDEITTSASVVDKRPDKNIVVLYCKCENQDNQEVVSGMAEVIAPADKITINKSEFPELDLEKLLCST